MSRKHRVSLLLLFLIVLPPSVPVRALEVGGIVLKRGPQDTVRVSRRDWTWGYVEKHPVISFEMKSNRSGPYSGGKSSGLRSKRHS